MTWLLIPMALALLGFVGSTAAPAADFFVSTRGRDSWSGRLASPNVTRTDGPFATVPRAQQAVRALKAAHPSRDTPIVVSIGGGAYFLSGPLVFTPEDSGTAAAPVIYRAADARRPPVFSGGVRLRGFTQTPAGAWQLTIPEVARGEWRFAQLFVNGHRRFRPRLPKGSYHFIAGALPSTPENDGKGYDRFRFAPGDIDANWRNLNDVEVLVFHNWTMDRLRIASVDEAQRAVTLTGPTVAPMECFDLAKGRRYIIENVREALTEPGEWYLDRSTGVLTYLPMARESLSRAVVIAPRLDTLVRFAGDPAAGRWVEHLVLHGLVFAHTNWVAPPQGYACGQAESVLPGAITATGARHCTLEGCVVRQVGTYAVEWGAGCSDDQLVDCDLTDLGAGGVKIGDTNLYDDPNLVASSNAVRNCSITHGGRLHPAGIGVWVGQSHHNTIEHNEISDLYYSALSLGWTWGYGPSQCNSNTIAYNNIHLLGQQVLSDLGGIYTLGISPGTTIHHNRFYDIDYFYYGGWGIYFDEGSTGIVAENNLIHDTHGGCFHQHYGENNTFRNNILAFDKSQQIARTRPEDHLSFTFDHNLVYYREGSLLGGNWTWTGGNYAFDANCYWDVSGRPVTFDGLTPEEWQSQRGQDLHSLIADPLFVDPNHGDYTLQPGSPALGLGFVPFDLSTTGRTTRPRDPLTKQTFPRAFPAAPPPPPIFDDFEFTAVGSQAEGATTWEENEQATIRVTSETAATGSQSLKVTDAPGQTYEYNPHFYYTPAAGLSQGVLEGSFDWRLEPGAYGYHEWRDWPSGSSYSVGPSLWMNSDGWAYAAGQRLFEIPYSTWMHLAVTCATGTAATGTWNLTVSWPGLAAPLHFDNLPCDPNFRTVTWYGWSSTATWEATFYLDSIGLRQVGPSVGQVSNLPSPR